LSMSKQLVQQTQLQETKNQYLQGSLIIAEEYLVFDSKNVYRTKLPILHFVANSVALDNSASLS